MAVFFKIDKLCYSDSVENYAVMYWEDSDVKFLVRHNFRRENRNEIADKLRKDCKNITNPRDGKTVYIGSTWRTVQTKEKGEAWYDCLQCFAYHWHAGNEKTGYANSA